MGAQLGPQLTEVTERIIGCAFTVANELGHGFLEAVYKRALVEELRAEGIPFKVEKPYAIHYRGTIIGRYVADIIVDEAVLVELKAVAALSNLHLMQVRNYLKASLLRVGLLLNFGTPSVEIRRVLPERPCNLPNPQKSP